MTIREKLSAVRGRAMAVALAAWLVFIGGILLAGAHPAGGVLAAVAFAAFMGAVLYGLFGIRCPRCRSALGHALQWPPSMFRIPRAVRFCPFCGADFDEELEDEGADGRAPPA